MSRDLDDRISKASQAGPEDIARYLHDSSPKIIKALLNNKNLTEQDALIIANRKNLPGETLQTIYSDKRWADSYQMRLALAKNPKTPLFVSLSIARGLRLFDLADLSGSRLLPLAYRHKLEAIIIERLPALALGLKTSLAKMASGNVLMKMMEDGNPEVVKYCLNNPHMVEANLYKIINRPHTVPGTIRIIAAHPNWSSRYVIRISLMRNRHTPLAQTARFLPDMKTGDLRDLYFDPSVTTGVKPYIHKELWERGEEIRKKDAEQNSVYEISGEGGYDRLEHEDHDST